MAVLAIFLCFPLGIIALLFALKVRMCTKYTLHLIDVLYLYAYSCYNTYIRAGAHGPAGPTLAGPLFQLLFFKNCQLHLIVGLTLFCHVQDNYCLLRWC